MGLELELDAGVKFDIVTHEELKKALESLKDNPETIWEGNNGSTDASGNISLFVYRVPAGKLLVVERLIIWADGVNPHTPDTTGWWGLYSGAAQNPGNLLEYAPQPGQTTVVPFINSYNHNAAPRFNGGTEVYLYGTTMKVSTNIGVIFQGCLEPVQHKRHGI